MGFGFVNFLGMGFWFRFEAAKFVNFFGCGFGLRGNLERIFWNLKFGFGFVNFGLRFEGKFFLQNFAFARFLDLVKFVNFLGIRFGFGGAKFVMNFLGLNLRKFGIFLDFEFLHFLTIVNFANFLLVIFFWILT